MKRSIAPLLCVAGLAIPVSAQAAAVPAATVTISNVSGAAFDITHGAGWSWPATGAGCAVVADVSETQIAPPNDPATGTVSDSFAAGTLNGHNPATLTLTDTTGTYTVDSASSISATCHLRRSTRVTVKHVTRHTAKKQGSSKTTRKAAAYLPGGSCNWGGDGNGGGITTCLFAHVSITYRFLLPKNSTFLSVGHTVSAGLEPCRNKGWKVTHLKRKYSVTFHHGSVAGFSQCDIHGVSFNYRRTTTTTATKYVTTTAATTWP